MEKNAKIFITTNFSNDEKNVRYTFNESKEKIQSNKNVNSHVCHMLFSRLFFFNHLHVYMFVYLSIVVRCSACVCVPLVNFLRYIRYFIFVLLTFRYNKINKGEQNSKLCTIGRKESH